MRTICGIFLGLFLLGHATASLALSPSHFWSQRFGSAMVDVGNGIAVDNLGNIVVTGTFTGTVDFGGGNLVSAGGNDMFLAKYDPTGAHLWSKRYGGASGDAGNAIAVDNLDNIVVTGRFNGTVNFGGVDLVSAGSDDIFLAKYTSSGDYQWSQRYGAASADAGNSVAVDDSANVLVTGYFQGALSFGGGVFTSVGGTDIFLAKYNSSGVHRWSRRFGSTGTDHGKTVAVDDSRNVVATGYYNGTVNFGGGNLVSAGAEDIFLLKYNPNGVHQWSKRFGSTGADAGYGVAVDDLANVVATGQFNGTVDFGGGNLVSAGDDDIFLAQYNSGGAHLWSQRFGGAGSDAGTAVAIDGSANAVVTGTTTGTVDLGGGNLGGGGEYDVFLAKYNSSGVHQWGQVFGGTSPDFGIAVAVDGLGGVVVTGSFQGGVSFGGATLVGAGGVDIFLVRYGADVAEPFITSITDIGNDQGRTVKIRWSRSGRDDFQASLPTMNYEAYRRDDAPPASSVAWRNPAGLSESQLLSLGWTQVGSVAAHTEDGYGIDVPTIGDSTITLGQYHSVFFIRASTALPSIYFDSPIDSGYSLDNLAPGVPAAFAYSAGQLSWDESSAEDFDYFSVYGSDTNSFGSATLIDYSVSPAMDVNASPYVFYFVTATDFSGNEGKPAVVNALSGVGGTPKHYVLSLSAYPNPFNPETTIRYTVPSKGRVTLEVFDARGARVATLIHAERDAGAYTVEWDGRDDRGTPSGSGVYFGRLTSPAGARSYKLTLLK